MAGRYMFARRRRFRGRRGRRFSLFTKTVDHYETTATITTGGTEEQYALNTATDAPNDRGSDIPAGAILKSITYVVTPQAILAGKYQMMMLRQPGATTFTTPIGSYFATTDPATEAMIKARKYCMVAPKTARVVTGALVPLRMVLSWRGNMKMQDGDDIVLSIIAPSSTQVFDIRVYKRYLHL